MEHFHRKLNSIVKRIQAGDIRKKKDFYVETCSYLKLVALRYAFDKNEYEDILMDAYNRMFLYIKKCDTKKGAFNWCCKIVERVAYDYNGKIKYYVPIEYASFDDVLGCEMERFLLEDAVVRSVNRLTEIEQNLIFMKFYEDLTYEEMAKALDAKKSTVYKQTQVAMKKLEIIMKKQ